MHVVGIWLMAHIGVRVGRGIQVLIRLVMDRNLVRALPWRYIRLRLKQPRAILHLAGCVGIAVLLPMAAISPSFEFLGWIGFIIWAIPAVISWSRD